MNIFDDTDFNTDKRPHFFVQPSLIKYHMVQFNRERFLQFLKAGHPVTPLAYLIFVLFSPQTQFLAQFLSTPKRVNHDKTDFATKQCKSHKREILKQNSIKCYKTSKIVHIMLTDLSPHLSCGEISPCDRFSPHLKGTISAFNLKFLHMVPVTNMRYDHLPLCQDQQVARQHTTVRNSGLKV